MCVSVCVDARALTFVHAYVRTHVLPQSHYILQVSASTPTPPEPFPPPPPNPQNCTRFMVAGAGQLDVNGVYVQVTVKPSAPSTAADHIGADIGAEIHGKGHSTLLAAERDDPSAVEGGLVFQKDANHQLYSFCFGVHKCRWTLAHMGKPPTYYATAATNDNRTVPVSGYRGGVPPGPTVTCDLDSISGQHLR
jgi:hypothetical protein